jgi:hypothetical protein
MKGVYSMRSNVLIAAAFLMTVCLFTVGGPVNAQDKMGFNASDGIREVLTANVGKRVALRTDAGETMEGIVSIVGTQLVRLEKLTGKDFYDALVPIDRINSLTIRVRGN